MENLIIKLKLILLVLKAILTTLNKKTKVVSYFVYLFAF
jgi:hypothetical protein